MIDTFCSSSSSLPPYILANAAEAELNDDRETVKSKFFPLYHKILDYWFTGADGYYICPHWTIPDSRKPVKFVSYVIKHRGRPLLLLEVKPLSDFRRDSGRLNAISQVIERLDEIGPTNQDVQRLYAISAIGKKWRAACVTKGNGSRGGQPVKGVAELNSLRSSDARCWNPDITSDASYDALQSIVDTIKSYLT
jgi:hypothetical protein